MNLQGIALHGHMKPVTMIKFTREGDLLFSVAKEPNISVWNTKNGERLGTYTGHSAIAACDVNNNSTLLATAGMDFRARLWCVESGNYLTEISLDTPAKAIEFAHDDGRLLVSTTKKMGFKSTIQLYNLPISIPKTGYLFEEIRTEFTPCATFECEDDDITFATWGPTNDRIYYSTNDGSVSILDVETMRTIRTQKVHDDIVNRIHFDSNYLTLISASEDRTARLLDSRDCTMIQTYESDVPVNDAAISPCGDHIILGGGMDAQDVTTQGGQSTFEVKFYHKVHERPLGQVRCHFGTINTVAFYPNGRGFASGAFDGLVKLHTFDDNYNSAPGSKPLWEPNTSISNEE